MPNEARLSARTRPLAPASQLPVTPRATSAHARAGVSAPARAAAALAATVFAAAVVAMPLSTLHAQNAAPTAPAKTAPAKAAPAAAAIRAVDAPVTKVEPIRLIVGKEVCVINDPFSKAPLDGAKWTVRAGDLLRNERVPGGTGTVLRRLRLADTVAIEWPAPPKQMEDAIVAYQRGDAQAALNIIQDVLNFFERMKKDTPGSLWLKAANIKLDALMVLQNDTVLTNFINELEAVDSSGIPGLSDRVKLAKLAQIARQNNPKATIAEADTLIRTASANEVLAQAHIFKGDALLADRQPEKAMNAYLRVNVFYGNPPNYIPAAQLGAAKAFRAMETPANRDLKLGDIANAYLRDVIKEYPLTKEAAIAKTMLPKDEREAEVAAAAARERAVEAATEKKSDPNDVIVKPEATSTETAAPATESAAETAPAETPPAAAAE